MHVVTGKSCFLLVFYYPERKHIIIKLLSLQIFNYQLLLLLWVVYDDKLGTFAMLSCKATLQRLCAAASGLHGYKFVNSMQLEGNYYQTPHAIKPVSLSMSIYCSQVLNFQFQESSNPVQSSPVIVYRLDGL